MPRLLPVVPQAPSTPVAIPVATVVDTVGDSWKRTFWTILPLIFNFIVTVAIWNNQAALLEELRGSRLPLLSEGSGSIHEKLKSCDSKLRAAQAEVQDIRKRLPSNDDSASVSDSQLHVENGTTWRDWISQALKVLSKDKIQESTADEQQEDEVPLSSTSTIGFDDVSTTTTLDSIPDGYHGLEWENISVMHRFWYPGSGLQHGVVSGNHGAFNGNGGPITITSATPFSVAGFQVTAAWGKDMHILVEGFGDGGNHIGSYQTTLGNPHGGPTFIDLRREGNFKGLHKLTITPSGGTNTGRRFYFGDGNENYVAIDDLKVY